MSQAIFSSINPNTTSGTDLATILNDFKDAMVSGLSGTTRPTNLQAGGYWIDTTNDPTTWAYKMYTGVTDVTIFTLNLSTGVATMASADTLFEIAKVSNDAVGPILRLLKERIAGGGQVLDGDSIGEISFYGTRDTGVNVEQAAIRAYSSDNVTASAQGAYLVFEVTNDAAAAVTEAMRLVDSKLGIGTATPEDALHVVGNAIRSEKASDDTVGSKFVGKKGRVAGDGQVENGDIVLEVEALAKDDAASFNAIAAIRMEAIEDQTATAQGSRVVIATTPVTGIGQDDIVQVTSALVTIDTDLTVAGNLVVQGTTLLESTVVEIEDAAIILNKGGDQASANAQDSGFVVEMSDATDAGIGYDSTMASRFKLGEIGSQEQIATVGHTQTLTNKTMTAPVLNNASIVTPTRSDIKQDTQANLETYAATATNGQLCFATDTKVAYQVVDNALVELGSGSGGVLNNIDNSQAKIDTSGWVVYANTTPSALPDDFGGTPNVDFTWTRSTSSPLVGAASFLLTKTANDRQGHGVYVPFDIENADRTLMQLISFLKEDSTNVVDGDLIVGCMTSDDNFVASFNLILPSNQDLLAGIIQVFKQVQFNSVDTKARFFIHVATTSALAYTVKFDEFFLGRSPVATSALRLDDKEYVPATTQGLGTIASTDLFHDVDGEYINISGKLVIGTPTAVEARIALPDGMISSSKIPTLEIAGVYGQGNVGAVSGYVSIEPSKTYFVFTIQNAGNGALTKQNGSAIFGAGVTVSIKARIKIEGQSSNAASSIDLGARDIVLNLVGSGATQSITDNSATKATNWTVSEDTIAGWDSVNSRYTIQESGYYDVSASAIFSSDAGNDVGSQRCDLYKNGSLLFRGEAGTNTLIANRYQPAVNVTSVKLLRGDYIEVFVYQDNTSGNANNLTGAATSQWLQIAKKASPQTILAAQAVYGNYTKTDAQAIANNTVTSVIWNTTVETTNANWMNTSTGELTVGENGNYQFNAGASLVSATVGTGVVFVEIYKNGTRVSRGVVNGIDDGGAGSSVSHSMYCNKNDVITTRIVHTNGVSRNLATMAGVNTFSYHRTN